MKCVFHQKGMERVVKGSHECSVVGIPVLGGELLTIDLSLCPYKFIIDFPYCGMTILYQIENDIKV